MPFQNTRWRRSGAAYTEKAETPEEILKRKSPPLLSDPCSTNHFWQMTKPKLWIVVDKSQSIYSSCWILMNLYLLTPSRVRVVWPCKKHHEENGNLKNWKCWNMSQSGALLVNLVTICHTSNNYMNQLHLQLCCHNICVCKDLVCILWAFLQISPKITELIGAVCQDTLPAFPVSQTCRGRWMEFADIIRISRVDNVRLRRPAEPHAEVKTEIMRVYMPS